MQLDINSILILSGIIVLIFALIIFYLKLQLSKVHEKRFENIENKLEELVKQYNTTPREVDVLREIIKGKTAEEIANSLFMSVGTVKNHKNNIYKKFNVNSVVKLLNKIIEGAL